MTTRAHMTPQQVDEMIASLQTRRVKNFKVAHCLKIRQGIWCLDINVIRSSVALVKEALVEYCAKHGREGLMNAAGPRGWKAFVAAPREIVAPETVRIPEAFNAVLIVVRTQRA